MKKESVCSFCWIFIVTVDSTILVYMITRKMLIQKIGYNMATTWASTKRICLPLAYLDRNRMRLKMTKYQVGGLGGGLAGS